VTHEGRSQTPNAKNRWKTNEEGMRRLVQAGRLLPQATTHRYLRYFDDFPGYSLHSLWTDVGGAADRRYVVQTTEPVIERCLLMTTRPGDLVLDPTCGSGTTAYVAEQWGRRWVSIDTSRVAIAIARQRLLTAKYDFYEVKGTAAAPAADLTGIDPHPGFVYKTVPHVTLKSIAQNANLDPIFARHEPILDDCLAACNLALAAVPARLKTDGPNRAWLEKDGKRLRFEVLSPAKVTIESWPADAPPRDYDSRNPGVSVVGFTVPIQPGEKLSLKVSLRSGVGATKPD
jgi:adenine-specific DNA-methyltransferase